MCDTFVAGGRTRVAGVLDFLLQEGIDVAGVLRGGLHDHPPRHGLAQEVQPAGGVRQLGRQAGRHLARAGRLCLRRLQPGQHLRETCDLPLECKRDSGGRQKSNAA
eukprot:1186476-Prorocentrum_minimum.AAC.9